MQIDFEGVIYLPFYVEVIIRILLAALMGGLIGSERGRHGRAAGLRTHILVCLGAAMTSLTSLYLSEILGYTGDIARISAQVISGIGFLGAGTIMIRNNSVITGLTTAAGMWATATIGISIGYGFYVGAVVATLVCIFSVTFLNRLEAPRKSYVTFYIELSDIKGTSAVAEIIKEDRVNLVSYDIIPAKSNIPNNLGIVCTVSNETTYLKIKEKLKNFDAITIFLRDMSI